MSFPSNIDKFETISGAVLGFVFVNFPSPRSFDFNQIELKDGENSYDSPAIRFETIVWLIKAGIIESRTVDQSDGEVRSAELTPKGYAALRLEGPGTDKSLGYLLADAYEAGDIESLRSFASIAIQQALSFE